MITSTRRKERNEKKEKKKKSLHGQGKRMFYLITLKWQLWHKTVGVKPWN